MARNISGLIPFKKGQSGNPKGKPKGTRDIRTMLSEYGELDTPDQLVDKLRTMFPQLGQKKIPLADAMWLSAYVHAINDPTWAKMIADRVEGKPKETVRVENAGGGENEYIDKLAQMTPDEISALIKAERERIAGHATQPDAA